MSHIEQSTRRVSLNPHILAFGQSSKRDQRARFSNLRLVFIYLLALVSFFQLTMRCKIRDASNSIALNLNIGRKHLTNQGFQSAERDNEEFVFSCTVSIGQTLVPTIHGQISQRRTGRSLNFRIVAGQEVQHRVKSITSDFADFLFRNFGKC